MTQPPTPPEPHEDPADGNRPEDAAPSPASKPLDADAVERLAAIDDQLSGLSRPDADDQVGDAGLTAELAERLDTLLLLRMVAAAEAKAPPPLVIGKFRVVRKIGEGGFAEVFEVIDTKLVRRAALKIARPEIIIDPRKTGRFVREAKHAAKVSHPSVVIVHEVGDHDGLPYIAQELCGESLASWLDRHPGPVSPRVAAHVVRSLADAAHAAHAVGVFHRDIKPGNVLLVPSDEGPLPPDERAPAVGSAGEAPGARRQGVKLGDFGLSASIVHSEYDSPSTAPTEINAILGTPEWMAPEQVQPALGPMDARTDVHALGLVLDRLLTGRCVNASESRDGIYRRVLEVEPVPADRVVPGIPADLVAVCSKCLAKKPADRYQSAAELAVDLTRFLDGRPTIARPLTPAQHAGRWLRRNPTLAGAIAASLVALLLGGLVVAERSRSAAREAREQADKAARDAARDLRRAFESYRNGDAAGAVDDLRKSAAADPALADSLAGGWLLARTHGETTILVDRSRTAPPGDEDALQIHSLALSPSADRLAAGAADGMLFLLALAPDGTAAGSPIEIDAGHEINQVVFSPDGTVVATAGKLRETKEQQDAETGQDPVGVGRVRLWNVADGSHRRDIAVGGQEIFSVAFSPSGDRIAWGGADRVIEIAALAGDGVPPPTVLRPFDSPGIVRDPIADIELLRFLDEERMLVAIHERLCLVDLATGGIERSFEGEQGDVQAFALSPDGKRLVVGGWYQHVVRVWELATGTLELETDGVTQWIQGCGFSPDGRRIVAGCKDGVIRVYECPGGEPVGELVGHLARIWNVLYHPSGRILSAAGDGTVRLWDPATAPSVRGATTMPLPGLPSAEALADLGDGRLLVVPSEGVPAIVDATGTSRPIEGVEVSTTYGIAVDRDRRRCAIAAASGLIVFPYPGDGNRSEPTVLSSSPCFTVAWGKDGRLFAGMEEKDKTDACWVWPPDLGAPRRLDGEYTADVDSIAVWSGPRPRVAISAGAVITIHDLGPDGAPAPGSGRRLADLVDEMGLWLRIAWSPDGTRLAVGSTKGEVAILDAATGHVAVDVGPFMRPVRGLVWAENGRSLVVAAEHALRLVDAQSGVTLDEIRPDWAISGIAAMTGADGRPALAVTGNRFSLYRRKRPFEERAPAFGRFLLLDVGHRLPADVPRGQ